VLHGTYEQPDYMKNGPRKYLPSKTEETEDFNVIKEESKMNGYRNVSGIYFMCLCLLILPK
jgi:hypothetical protein